MCDVVMGFANCSSDVVMGSANCSSDVEMGFANCTGGSPPRHPPNTAFSCWVPLPVLTPPAAASAHRSLCSWRTELLRGLRGFGRSGRSGNAVGNAFGLQFLLYWRGHAVLARTYLHKLCSPALPRPHEAKEGREEGEDGGGVGNKEISEGDEESSEGKGRTRRKEKEKKDK